MPLGFDVGKFGEVLAKVKEKLDQASKTLETDIGVRTRAIQRKLREVNWGLNYMIPGRLPYTASVAHKIGFYADLDGWVNNDAGIVTFTGGDGTTKAYAITYLSQQAPTEADGYVLAAILSRLAWNYLAPKYGAAVWPAYEPGEEPPPTQPATTPQPATPTVTPGPTRTPRIITPAPTTPPPGTPVPTVITTAVPTATPVPVPTLP